MSVSRSASAEGSGETSRRSPSPAAVREFRFEGFEGAIAERYEPADLEAELRRLIDPGSALRTVHWGRNYLYEALMRCRDRDEVVVVKAFRNEGLKRRLRRRWGGSKALRSWRASLAMLEAGVAVAEPVAVVDSRQADGPSYFVARKLDSLEGRYVFRALNSGRERELFPDIDTDRFLDSLGALLRRMHDGGLWHRDVSAGNVLLCEGGVAPPEENLHLVDLNRARRKQRLALRRRMRDLSRLPIFVADHQTRLLEAYWSPDEIRGRGLYLAYHRGFLAKNSLKKGLRGFLGRLKRLLPRTRHVHIGEAQADAGARDRVVWDGLSDQPHQHAGRLTKLRVRAADAGSHLRGAAAIVRSLPATIRTYRRLQRRPESTPVAWSEAGICVAAADWRFEEVAPLLAELGTRRVMLRLHAWDRDQRQAAALATELSGAGYELCFAVPQNRDLVRDLARWRASLVEIEDRFLGLGTHVQVGQAINRSKWGVWNLKEHERLVEVANDVLRRRPETRLMGPAIIDFEPYQTAMVLNVVSPELLFDVVTSLLYVDRRGAPENKQTGFDTVDKVTLLRAVVAASRHGDRPCWITEVNWPLAEGPHSPAGRAVVVDEETQADYLVRYYLLTLGSGMVERVYWWQLVARGYGLVNPLDGELLERPSFRAFKQMTRQLAGTLICRQKIQNDPRAYVYRVTGRPDGEWAIGWCTGDTPREIDMASPVAEILDRDGTPVESAGGTAAVLTPSPRYFRLGDR